MTRKAKSRDLLPKGTGAEAYAKDRAVCQVVLFHSILEFYFLYVVMHYDVYRYSPRLIECEAIIHST
jgi:hypothetical protein